MNVRSRDTFQIRDEAYGSIKHIRVMGDLCRKQTKLQFQKRHAPVEVPAHDVHVQRHERRHAVKSRLKGSGRLCAAAQKLDKGRRHEAHVGEKRGGSAREESDCSG